MTQIHQIYIESSVKLYSPKKIIKLIINQLPKHLYVLNEYLSYTVSKDYQKTTAILKSLNTSDIIIIKLYDENTIKMPDELIYLLQHHKSHLFYQNCFLGYCRYNNYNISIVKCTKADGDIDNISLSVANINVLKEMILDEIYDMHKNNYVHMDIKTTNILYIKERDKIKFGLCDFELCSKPNDYITHDFRNYYHQLYRIKHIPKYYTCAFELQTLNYIIKLLIKHKRIKAITI